MTPRSPGSHNSALSFLSPALGGHWFSQDPHTRWGTLGAMLRPGRTGGSQTLHPQAPSSWLHLITPQLAAHSGGQAQPTRSWIVCSHSGVSAGVSAFLLSLAETLEGGAPDLAVSPLIHFLFPSPTCCLTSFLFPSEPLPERLPQLLSVSALSSASSVPRGVCVITQAGALLPEKQLCSLGRVTWPLCAGGLLLGHMGTRLKPHDRVG